MLGGAEWGGGAGQRPGGGVAVEGWGLCGDRRISDQRVGGWGSGRTGVGWGGVAARPVARAATRNAVRSALSLASRSLRHRLRCGFTDLVRCFWGVFLLCWLALPGSVVPTYASSPSCFYAGLFPPRGQGEKGA